MSEIVKNLLTLRYDFTKTGIIILFINYLKI